MEKDNQNIFSEIDYLKETKMAREIKVIAEVEKIWILYDLDENGELDYEEISHYLKEVAYPHLKMTQDHIRSIFDSIDSDGNGTIDKDEMVKFVDTLLQFRKKILKHKKL